MADERVDVCVVGSGAAGSVMAYALGRAGLKVLVLEAGPRFDPSQYDMHRPDWELRPVVFEPTGSNRAKARYSTGPAEPLDPQYEHLRSWSEVDGVLITSGKRVAPRIHRVKGVGGTTLHYQGEAHRFSPHGFQSRRLLGYAEDWPLTYDELAPYYEEMEHLLGVAGDHRNPFKAPRGPFPNPPHALSCASQVVKRGFDRLGLHLHPNSLAILSRPYDDRMGCVYCNGCSRGCMTRAKSSADVAIIPKAEATGRVTVRANCVVSRVTTDSRGFADGLLYFDAEKREHRVDAGAVVVAAGALESPRLLLNSASQAFPEGLANRSGLVGRYFMETLYHTTTALFREPLHSYQGLQIDSRAWDDNASKSGRPFAGGVVLGVSASSLLGPATYAVSMAKGWGDTHKQFMRNYFGHAVTIFANGEQLPHIDNRIDLDPETKDFYGLPVARITTRLRTNDLEMLTFMRARCRAVAEAAGAERIVGDESAYDISSITHMGGTCRIGVDQKSSVANAYGQTHDVPNLYVADSSCFVTQGGGDSPSLTIQALALRAAEHCVTQAKRAFHA
ncbi:MAG: GMC family oxidoreductase [Nitrospiraceae bacterium]